MHSVKEWVAVWRVLSVDAGLCAVALGRGRPIPLGWKARFVTNGLLFARNTSSVCQCRLKKCMTVLPLATQIVEACKVGKVRLTRARSCGCLSRSVHVMSGCDRWYRVKGTLIHRQKTKKTQHKKTKTKSKTKDKKTKTKTSSFIPCLGVRRSSA